MHVVQEIGVGVFGRMLSNRRLSCSKKELEKVSRLLWIVVLTVDCAYFCVRFDSALSFPFGGTKSASPSPPPPELSPDGFRRETWEESLCLFRHQRRQRKVPFSFFVPRIPLDSLLRCVRLWEGLEVARMHISHIPPSTWFSEPLDAFNSQLKWDPTMLGFSP